MNNQLITTNAANAYTDSYAMLNPDQENLLISLLEVTTRNNDREEAETKLTVNTPTLLANDKRMFGDYKILEKI